MSLIEFFFVLFFFFFFFFWGGGGGGAGGGGLWSYVHHTVAVKILCSDVVRPSGCPFIFLLSMSYLMILSKLSGDRRYSTLMPLVHLNTGSIMLLVVMLSVRLFACLSVCLSVCPSYIHLSSYFSCPLHISFTSESFYATS